MLYTISGEYEFFLEVRISNPKNISQTQKQLMENSNITINAFNGSNSKLPIPCKYSWFRIQNLIQQKQIKIPQQGNIYQCCIQDVGSNIQAVIESFDDEFAGKALVSFNQLGISDQLRSILQQLFTNGLDIQTQIQQIQLKWHFQMDGLTISQKYQFAYPQNLELMASNQDVTRVEFMNTYFLIEEIRNLIWNKHVILTFKCREDRGLLQHDYHYSDLFVGVFILQKNLQSIRVDMILQNLDKIIPGNEDAILKLFSRLQSSQSLSVKQRPFSSRQSDEDMKDQMSKLQNENSSLKKQQSYMKSQMDALSKQNSQLKSELHSKRSTPFKEGDDEARMQKMVQSLQQELKQCKQREENYKFQIQQLEQEIGRSKELNVRQQYNNIIISQSMRQSSYVVDDSQVKYLEARIEEAKKINNKLMEELKKKNQQSNGLQDLKQQIYILEKENRSLKGQKLDGNQYQTSNLMQTNEKLMQENNDLLMKVKELEEEIEVIRALSRSQISMSGVMNRDDDLMNLKMQIEEVEKENTYLKKKMEKMQQDQNHKSSNHELNKLKEQNQKYVEENMRLFDEIKQLKDQQDMQSSVNQSGFYHLEEENLRLRKENSVLKQELQKRNKKIEELERSTQGSNNSRLLKLEIENEKLKRDLEERHPSKNGNEIKILQMQNERLQQTNQRMMEENLELMSQLKQLQDERDNRSVSFDKWVI